MSEASVSIVIPVRNRAAIVGRTLDSVLRQTLRPLEVILVDNASTDSTLDVLKQWQQQHNSEQLKITILNEPKPGACDARNRGLEAVQTPWVMFFDSDDTMVPTLLAHAMELADEHPDLDLIYWDIFKQNEANGPYHLYHFGDSDLLFDSLFHGMLGTQHYLARTDLHRRVGGWNPALTNYDDRELSIRLLAEKPRTMALPSDAPVMMNYTADSITHEDGNAALSGMDAAMSFIRKELPEDKHIWIDLKRAIEYAAAKRPAGCLDTLVCHYPQKRRRRLIRFVYYYTRFGGRGAGRLLRLFRNHL